MQFTGALIAALSMVDVSAAPSVGQSSTAQAEEHLRQACEIVWARAKPYQIERCTRRAMAMLGNNDQLRDNELKRLLVDSERELESCRQTLDRARDELARHEASDAPATSNPGSSASETVSHP